MRKWIILLVSGYLFPACLPDKSGQGLITYANIEKHIVELSSDKYQGRMPMTFTESAVTGYIAGQMKEVGLEPAANGSYFQDVPILSVSSTISPDLHFSTPEGTLDLPKMTSYVSFTRKMEKELVLTDSEVIFAGFGILAPEFGRNDFEEVDIKGKTLIVFVNDPGYGTDGDYFRGNTMTYYGRWTYKFEEAARQGAKACFIIHETGPAGYGWNVVSNNGESTKLYLVPENGYSDRCDLEGWISLESARELFSRCGYDLDQLKEKAKSPGFRSFPLPLQVSGWIKNSFQTGVSRNVCGLVKGSVRPEEVVVYTAHWDHLGIGTAVKGDSVYNGATDNASAVSWMLEIARAFTTGAKPERSVLFISPTGEESGLLGAEYYVSHPLFDLKKTVACINTDVLLFAGKFNDVTLTGDGYSELDEWVKEAALAQGRYITSDPEPGNGMFFRSDHFPFVKRGIPSIFAKGYTDAAKLGPEKTREMIKQYWKTVYHSPQDEYVPQRDDLSGLMDDAVLMYSVGMKLANTTAFPGWKEGAGWKR
ncbi:MAG TPA: M28 family peptidase [Prolixibacteraceae bacterium]|nr:M28 family peptidase [Prolixibacteraceae bacterium]